MSIKIEFHVAGVQQATRQILGAGPIVNQELNRAYQGIGGDVMRRFAADPGVNVRRGIKGGHGSRRKGKQRGQPFVPRKAKSLGFFAHISNLDDPHRKTLTMGTSNRQAIIHEFGGPIRPDKKKALTVRGKRGRGNNRKIIALAKRVRIPARLNFRSAAAASQGDINLRFSTLAHRVERRLRQSPSSAVRLLRRIPAA